MTLINPKRLITNVFPEMENSNQEFYLTGSRFFGTHNENSDWDFFTEDCPEVRKELENLGFVEEQNSYSDDLTNKVYVHQSARIHVQCVKNVWAKTVIQDCIAELSNEIPSFLKNASKSRKKWLWQTLVNLIMQVQEI